MSRSMPKWAGLALRIAVLLFLVSAGAGLVLLGQERTQARRERDEWRQRADLLQEKYKQEKSRVSGLTRTRLALEGQTRQLQQEAELLRKDVARLAPENEELGRKVEQLSAALHGRNAECAQGLDACRSEREQLTAQLRSVKAQGEQSVAGLTAEKEGLQGELARTSQKLQRCETHNARLCELTDELLQKFQDKGVVSAVLQREPLTQIQKAEMERMVQAYQDEMNRNALKRPQGN